MAFTTENELVQRIDAAFPDATFVGEATPCGCDECRDLAERVTSRSWRSFDVEGVRLMSAGTSLFTHEAFAHFLPAYMRACLVDYYEADVAFESTGWKFLPYDSADKVPFRNPSLLNPKQRGILFDWLEWFLQKEEEGLAVTRGIVPQGKRHEAVIKSQVRKSERRVAAQRAELERLRSDYEYED